MRKRELPKKVKQNIVRKERKLFIPRQEAKYNLKKKDR